MLASFVKKMKLHQNKRGFVILDFVIGLFIFLLVLFFAIDIILINMQRFQVHHVANTVVRVVKTQSGIEPNLPLGFHGTSGTYSTSPALDSRLNETFGGMNLDLSTLNVRIAGTQEDGTPIDVPLTNTSDIKLKYRTSFTVIIEYDYAWKAWSNFVPGTIKSRQSVKVSGVTEFKRDYDVWEGE